MAFWHEMSMSRLHLRPIYIMLDNSSEHICPYEEFYINMIFQQERTQE